MNRNEMSDKQEWDEQDDHKSKKQKLDYKYCKGILFRSWYFHGKWKVHLLSDWWQKKKIEEFSENLKIFHWLTLGVLYFPTIIWIYLRAGLKMKNIELKGQWGK